MEKRTWIKPEMNELAFAANDYVAACGDSGTVYKFVCDAAKKGGFNLGGTVYVENNKQQGFQSGGNNQDDYLGEYHACSATHEASKLDEFLHGWFKPHGLIDTKAREVIIWRGDDGNNIHCTTNLNMETWETAKS